jgi:hypothetical protein
VSRKTNDSRDRLLGLYRGPPSIRNTRGTPFWMANRRDDWKVASRFVSIGRLLLLGAYPSGAYLGNPD